MAGRRRKGKSDAAGRDEAYNQLNLMLLGAWQLLYNVQNGGKGAAGHKPSSRTACGGSIMLRWLRVSARMLRVGGRAAHWRLTSRA